MESLSTDSLICCQNTSTQTLWCFISAPDSCEPIELPALSKYEYALNKCETEVASLLASLFAFANVENARGASPKLHIAIRCSQRRSGLAVPRRALPYPTVTCAQPFQQPSVSANGLLMSYSAIHRGTCHSVRISYKARQFSSCYGSGQLAETAKEEAGAGDAENRETEGQQAECVNGSVTGI